ncbi:MAG: hypothetical protein Q8Q85_06175 [Gemmatimonadales bacterium]|nr:hypothetical protein [Gemmatimonadales bacterium]
MRTTIDIPDQLFRRAKKEAAEEGVTMREIVLRALKAHFGQPRATAYTFDWRVCDGEWNPDLPLHSREALEEYLGSWRSDLYG